MRFKSYEHFYFLWLLVQGLGKIIVMCFYEQDHRRLNWQCFLCKASRKTGSNVVPCTQGDVFSGLRAVQVEMKL